MKILHIIILDRLYDKYGYREIEVSEIRHQMNRVHRIPKNVVSIIIAEMINSKYLIKIGNHKYKLRKNIRDLIDSNMNEYNLMRNNTFC